MRWYGLRRSTFHYYAYRRSQSLCLLVLADIDHIYEEGRLPSGFLTAFEAHMTAIVFTTKAFGMSFNPSSECL